MKTSPMSLPFHSHQLRIDIFERKKERNTSLRATRKQQKYFQTSICSQSESKNESESESESESERERERERE